MDSLPYRATHSRVQGDNMYEKNGLCGPFFLEVDCFGLSVIEPVANAKANAGIGHVNVFVHIG